MSRNYCLLVEATEILGLSVPTAKLTTQRWILAWVGGLPQQNCPESAGKPGAHGRGWRAGDWVGGGPGHSEVPGNCLLSARSEWIITIWKIIPDPCGYREQDYWQILLPNFYLISVKCNLISQLIFILVMFSWGGSFHILERPLVSYRLCICVDYLTMLMVYSIFIFQILPIL